MAMFRINDSGKVDILDLTLEDVTALSNALFAGINNRNSSDKSTMRQIQDVVSDAYDDLVLQTLGVNMVKKNDPEFWPRHDSGLW